MVDFLEKLVHYVEPYIVYPDIIINVIDVAILTFVIYKIFKIIEKTSAQYVIRGIFLLVICTWITGFIGLSTINWLLRNLLSVGVIAVFVIFQPEIRRVLERFGGMLGIKTSGTTPSDASRIVNSIVTVVQKMADKNCGALIVIEKKNDLQRFIDSGIYLDAYVTEELLGNIFTHNAPLHDGAVIIRGDRVVAASCMLPLTQGHYSNQYGMRHRAAIGISEGTDAFSVVVSEETGKISITDSGAIFNNIEIQRLRERLLEVITVDVPGKKGIKSVLKGRIFNDRNSK